MRSSHYQHPGNPIQRHLIPKLKLPFEFPFAGDKRAEMLSARNQLLLLVVVIDIGLLFFALPYGQTFGRGLALLLVPFVILWGGKGVSHFETTPAASGSFIHARITARNPTRFGN